MLLLAVALQACGGVARPVPRGGAADVHGYLGGPERAGSVEERVDTAPRLAWAVEAGVGTRGALAVTDNAVVVATTEEWVHALSPETGETYWRRKGAGPHGVGPLIAQGMVFVGSEDRDGKVVALDLRTGEERWEHELGSIVAPLAYRDGMVYAASVSGRVVALDAASGERRWGARGARTRSGPLPVGPWIAVATLTDSLVVLDAATGRPVSRVRVGATTQAPMAALDDSTVILSDPRGAVFALGLPGGEQRWRVETGAPVLGAPTTVGDTVIALTSRCALWAIPTSIPPAARSRELGCRTVAGPALVRHGVLVATVGGDVMYVDRRSGRVVWTRSVGGALRHPPVVRNGRIFVAPTVGKVTSFR